MRLYIKPYSSEQYNLFISFLKNALKKDGRKIAFQNKDKDLLDIENNYLKEGFIWCLVDNKDNIYGTVALRKIEDFYEIRRFFIKKKYQNQGYGSRLLEKIIEYAIFNNINVIKTATLEHGHAIHHLLQKYGFTLTKRYNNSSADIFFKLELSSEYIYDYKLRKIKNVHKRSLILNPTENIPLYSEKYDTTFLEGLYISEHAKDSNDKIIFSGREEYIGFVDFIKKEWSKKLSASAVDLKPLSGLNTHLILFLCILEKNDTVMLLPEVCGGHYSTENILKSIGANVVLMEADYKHYKVDQKKTEEAIRIHKPRYILVDRSEGLYFEDFSWLGKYPDIYKIYDASQYISQILIGQYSSPFDMGFDMMMTTLHKNYPGPQKGLIAVKSLDPIWNKYIDNAKTYISSSHPMNIINSLIPLLDIEKFSEYINLNIECNRLLEEQLIEKGVPVVKLECNTPRTLHIWVLCKNQIKSYELYQRLESLNLFVNYRKLPYNLGFGLRIGTSAAVRMGLKPIHIKELAEIISVSYYSDALDYKLINKAETFIKQIIEK